MLRRLLPESIFPRKLSPTAESRLRLAQARAEEASIRAHVDNALMFVDTLAEDLSFDRAIDTYVRVWAFRNHWRASLRRARSLCSARIWFRSGGAIATATRDRTKRAGARDCGSTTPRMLVRDE